MAEKESTSLSDILLVGKQLRSLVESFLDSWERWWKFQDAKVARQKRRDFEQIEQALRDRLFGRYNIIYLLEGALCETPVQESRLNRVKDELKNRIGYLEQFNKEIPKLVAAVDPKLGAQIKKITETSIELYRNVAQIGDNETLSEVSQKLLPVLRDIAEFLERSLVRISKIRQA